MKYPRDSYSTFLRSKVKIKPCTHRALDPMLFVYVFFRTAHWPLLELLLQHLTRNDTNGWALHLANATNSTGNSSFPDSPKEYVPCFKFVQLAFTIFPCVFLGGWSNDHGRKLLLFLPAVGTIARDVVMIILVTSTGITKPFSFLWAVVPAGMGGDILLLAVAMMCYVADVTDHRVRTARYGILAFSGMVGVSFGTLLGGQWQNFVSPESVVLAVVCFYAVESTVNFLMALNVLVLTAESALTLGAFAGNPWKDLIVVGNLMGTVSSLCRQRDFGTRDFVLTTAGIIGFATFVLCGNQLVFPHFFQLQLNWDRTAFSIVEAVQYFVMALATLAVTALARRFIIGDAALGITGCISGIAAAILQALSNSTVELSLALMTTALFPLMLVAAFSLLSKLANGLDTGNLLAAAVALIPAISVAAHFAYGALLQVTVLIPEAGLLMSACLLSLCLLLFVHIRRNLSLETLGLAEAQERVPLLEHLDAGRGIIF